MDDSIARPKIKISFTFAVCEEKVLHMVRSIKQRTIVEIACSMLLAEWKSTSSQVKAVR